MLSGDFLNPPDHQISLVAYFLLVSIGGDRNLFLLNKKINML